MLIATLNEYSKRKNRKSCIERPQRPIFDTGAQASVTDNLSILQYYMKADDDIFSFRSVTGNNIKVLGFGSLILRLVENGCKIIRIPVVHCENINGTYISDDDLLEAGVEYRSIKGKPYLCWDKYHKVELNRVDKLIHFSESMYRNVKPLVAGAHEALGHIDKVAAERSVGKGQVRIAIEETERATDKCYDCQLSKARKCNHSKGSRDKCIIPTPYYLMHSDVLYIWVLQTILMNKMLQIQWENTDVLSRSYAILLECVTALL